jgi:hypothetical protein
MSSNSEINLNNLRVVVLKKICTIDTIAIITDAKTKIGKVVTHI